MIRWIAFDAVGTLIYPEPDVATAYALIGQAHGSRQTPDELRPRFAQVFAESSRVCLPDRDGDWFTDEEMERRRWRWIVDRMLPDASHPDACFDELYEHFARPESWRVFADVAETLEALSRQSLRLAIASNFDQRLHRVCAGFREFDVIEKIVVSTAVHACKPSAGFYQGLLAACGCGPEELWMVGDEYDADVAGPQALGIRAAWINTKSPEPPPHPSTIRSLSELVDLVSRLSEPEA